MWEQHKALFSEYKNPNSSEEIDVCTQPFDASAICLGLLMKFNF